MTDGRSARIGNMLASSRVLHCWRETLLGSRVIAGGDLVLIASLLSLVVAAVPAPAANQKPTLGKDAGATAAVDVNDPPIFPLKDIKAGLKGSGHTVFSSLRGPEPFSFEVLGVMRGYLGPGEDLIIARLVGEQIERTGVISGMSGSPAYIDGKLVGAVGYRFGQFTKDAIAGITPIERMLTGAPLPSTSGSARKPVYADTPWGRAEPIAIPISVSGLDPAVADAFAPLLRERGYGPMVAAGATSSSSDEKPSRFYASGPIAGLMVDGDIKMAGIGTVTWVKGDRFLAFGHPFMGTGLSSMPVSNAEIVTTVASASGSWKMGQATAAVGRLTDDRLHAIAGTMGDAPPMVPLSLRFDVPGPRKGSDARTTLSFRVMDHPTDTPLYAAMAIANALQNRISVEKGGTFDVEVIASLSTGQTVPLVARIADDSTDPAMPAAFAVLAGLSTLTESELAEAKLTKVDVFVRGRPEVDRLKIVAASMTSSAQAGEQAEVVVRLQPWRAAPVERRLKFKVPRGLTPGNYVVVAASDGSAARIERDGGMVGVPLTFDDEIQLLLKRPPPGSLSVFIVRDEASPRVEGQAIPGLPASLLEVVGGAGGVYGVGATEARASRVARVLDDGVIVGEASARFTVVE